MGVSGLVRGAGESAWGRNEARNGFPVRLFPQTPVCWAHSEASGSKTVIRWSQLNNTIWSFLYDLELTLMQTVVNANYWQMPEWLKNYNLFLWTSKSKVIKKKVKWSCSAIYSIAHEASFSSCFAGSITLCFSLFFKIQCFLGTQWGAERWVNFTRTVRSGVGLLGSLLGSHLFSAQSLTWLPGSKFATTAARASQSPWKRK